MSVLFVAALKILQNLKEYRAIDIYICFGGKASLVYAPCPSGIPLFA